MNDNMINCTEKRWAKIFGEAQKRKLSILSDSPKAQNEFALLYLSNGIKAQK